MNPISNISSPTILPGQSIGLPDAAKPASSFRNYLFDSIQEVNTMQQEADRAVEDLTTGGDATPAEVLTAVQEADIAFRLMIEVRDKMVNTFEEIKNMRV